MTNLRNLALSVLIAAIALVVYLRHGVCHLDPSPAKIHRARLSALAGAIDMYVIEEGHLPATLDDLAPPAEPSCITPDEPRGNDYRRDPDGVRIDYGIVDARTLRFRIAIPAHVTKAGAKVAAISFEEEAQAAGTSP